MVDHPIEALSLIAVGPHEWADHPFDQPPRVLLRGHLRQVAEEGILLSETDLGAAAVLVQFRAGVGHPLDEHGEELSPAPTQFGPVGRQLGEVGAA